MPGPIRLMVFQGYRPGYGSFGAVARPLLKRGSTGPFVVEAQEALMRVLQRSIPQGADGKFGSNTETAVREAQRMFNLPVTGVIDSETWTLLLGQEVLLSQSEKSSGGGSGSKSQNDGDFSVDISADVKPSNTVMLLGGLAVAGIAAYLLMGKKGQ